MKRQILLTAVTLTLIMTGCAQKKLNTTDNNGAASGADGTNVYQNVDPMGQGNGVYGNSGAGYGEGMNGIQNIYFNSDQYNISADKLGQVSHNASLLRANIAAGGKIKLEGHCDASGTDEYNYALGLRRAKATKDALQANGINGRSVTLVSMGESAPECTTSSSSECYAKNRRVEFKVIK